MKQISQNNNFVFSSTSLTIKNEPSYEAWSECGDWLNYVQSGVQWWIGDWLNYGERRWGEMAFQKLNGEDYAEKTLHNFKYVAAAIHSSRRREELNFSQHAEIASLPPCEQDRWLDKACANKLSTRELRRQIEQSCGHSDYENRLQTIIKMINNLTEEWPECRERIKEYLTD